MAGSVNKTILIGNLGRDPEIRSTQSGSRVAILALATSESWRDKTSGERQERTEWHRISIFNERLVEIAEKYLRKGAKVYVEGALQTRKWTDRDGQERHTTEIVLSQYRGELTMLDGARGEGSLSRRPMRLTNPRAAGTTHATISTMKFHSKQHAAQRARRTW